MLKKYTYSFVYAVLVFGSCEAMDEKKERPTPSWSQDDPSRMPFLPDRDFLHEWELPFGGFALRSPVASWRPMFVEQVGQPVPDSNPLENLIAAVENEPVVFGQNVEDYRFNIQKAVRPGGAHHRLIHDSKGLLRLRATLNPPASSIKGLNPNWITFESVDETLAEAEDSKNILTVAAVFLAERIAQHERDTGTGHHDNRFARRVAIPTRYGLYYAFNYIDACFGKRDIECVSKEEFETIVRLGF